MTLWKSLTAIQHRKLLTRENKKKVVEKFTSISSSLCVDSLKSRVISGQPIFLPRDANFRAKLPSHSGATKSLVTVFCISHQGHIQWFDWKKCNLRVVIMVLPHQLLCCGAAQTPFGSPKSNECRRVTTGDFSMLHFMIFQLGAEFETRL